MAIIELRNVSKLFHLHSDRPKSFQELAVRTVKREPYRAAREDLWALRDVSFDVQAGETVGLIGSNGSGKSTCLKLLARIFQPTQGEVKVGAQVSALLELGAGFHPELTGRENVFLYASVLGLGRREMARRFDEVVAFSEMERFIDVPTKFYSSGMYVRLAFATAINVNSQILLIDEVLAVGDESFQGKCLDRINELKASGMTIVFVSHDLDTVRSLCRRVVWLDNGVLREDGPSAMVVSHYLHDVYTEVEADPEPALPSASVVTLSDGGETVTGADQPAPESAPAADGEEPSGDNVRRRHRWGTRKADILGASFLDQDGHDGGARWVTSGPAIIAIRYRAYERLEHPVFGIAVYRQDGLHITGSNTCLARFDIPYIEGMGEVHYRMPALPLLAGDYILSVAIHSADQSEFYDYHNLYYPFHVEATVPTEGVIHIPGQWEHRPTGQTPATPTDTEIGAQ